MAQQLQRSWMIRVWSTVGLGSGGGGLGGSRSVSTRGFSNFALGRQVRAGTLIQQGLVRAPRSQALRVLCTSSSSSSAAPRNLRLTVSSGEQFRAGLGKRFANGFAASGRSVRTGRLPLLSPFLVKSLSSAEAQAVADGFVKDPLIKDAEAKDKSETVLAAAVGEGEEAETGLLTETAVIVKEDLEVAVEVVSKAVVAESETDEVIERETLIAEIRSKELELAELRNALRVVEEKQAGEVESGVSPAYPELDISAERAAASQVSAALEESDLDYENVTHAESEEYGGVSVSQMKGEEDGRRVEENDGSESVAHPWPEWIQFLERLNEGGYFLNEENTVVDMSGRANDDLGLIKRGCLNFARERDDIFLRYSRKDLEVIARFGCPCTDRKVVNAGKRMRDFLAIDEISVCKPCALRASCERRDFKANADHVSGTPEVMRLLSQYALEVSPYAKEGLEIPNAVQTACKNLLKETLTFGAVPRDPSLPKIERKSDVAPRSDRKERESRRKIRDVDVEMKPGDWKCEECQYVNFARNRTCRECDSLRPVPEMRPGDWRCPECSFLNFSRNQECHDCKLERPAGAGYNSSYDTGSRYERGAPQDRGSRFGRDRRSERDSYGRSRESDGPERRFTGGGARSGRRSNFEEWKPDLKKGGDFDEDELDDIDFDSDEAISDVEPLEDDEFEDMKSVATASTGRKDSRRNDDVWSRGGGRNDEKDSWFEDDRGYKSERSDRGSRGGGDGGRGRGRGRGGGRGGRGDFDRGKSSSRDSRSSSYDRYDGGSGRSYERPDRDSGRSYGRLDRDFDRPSRGRGGRKGGGRGRGRR